MMKYSLEYLFWFFVVLLKYPTQFVREFELLLVRFSWSLAKHTSVS